MNIECPYCNATGSIYQHRPGSKKTDSVAYLYPCKKHVINVTDEGEVVEKLNSIEFQLMDVSSEISNLK